MSKSCSDLSLGGWYKEFKGKFPSPGMAKFSSDKFVKILVASEAEVDGEILDKQSETKRIP